ncbi:MAG TPA: succinyldiaminopimelate transaminase, partial [Rhodocyclaceae bacterium]
MNPDLAKLQPYPFEKLRAMLAKGAPATPPALREIKLGIGEPQHATPEFIKQAL